MSSLTTNQRRKKRWAKKEISSLRQQLQIGTPLTEVMIPGRSRAAITYKVYALKLHSPTIWSKREIRQLKNSLQAGQPISQSTIINLRTGEKRSYSAKRAKAVRLNLKAQQPTKRKWTSQEKKLLIFLYQKQGLTARQIKAKGFFDQRISQGGKTLPARSINALTKMIQRLGLANPKRSERVSRGRKRMQGNLRSDLIAAIQKYAFVVPATRLGEAFGVSRSTVKRLMAKLGIIITWQQAVNLPGSKFKSEIFTQARRDYAKKAWQTRKAKAQNLK